MSLTSYEPKGHSQSGDLEREKEVQWVTVSVPLKAQIFEIRAKWKKKKKEQVQIGFILNASIVDWKNIET